jgi:hypothetical protein
LLNRVPAIANPKTPPKVLEKFTKAVVTAILLQNEKLTNGGIKVKKKKTLSMLSHLLLVCHCRLSSNNQSLHTAAILIPRRQ